MLKKIDKEPVRDVEEKISHTVWKIFQFGKMINGLV
jgi:hypothetical protein